MLKDKDGNPIDDITEAIVANDDRASIVGEKKIKDETEEDEEKLKDEEEKPEDDKKKDEDKLKDEEKPEDKIDKDDALEFLNSSLGTEHTSRDDVLAVGYKERLIELNNLSNSVTELTSNNDKLTKANKELLEKIDPLKFFANEDEYRRQQLLISHPDYDPATLSRVVNSDLEKLSPIEVLRLKIQLQDGDIYKTTQEVDEAIEDEYDVELTDGFDEIESRKKNKILKNAKMARKEFLELKQGVKLPEKVDYDKQKQEAFDKSKDQWSPFFKEDFIKALGKIEFTTKTKDGKVEKVFEFKVDEGYHKSINEKIDGIIETIAKRNVEFTKEGKQAIIKEFKDYYLKNNILKIMDAYANDKITQMDEEQFKKLQNPKPVSKKEAPESKTSAEKSKEKAEKEIEEDLP